MTLDPVVVMAKMYSRGIMFAARYLTVFGIWVLSFPHSSVSHLLRREASADCGTWQENYIKLHQEVLRGVRAPRFAVSVAVEAGLADRLTGTITDFFYALLTDRAFQIMTYHPLPGLETVFYMPNIKWYRPTDPDELIGPLKYTYKGERGYEGTRELGRDINQTKYAMQYMINDIGGSFNDFISSDLNSFPKGHANAEVVFLASNRGGTIRLFDNPHHAAQLRAFGLTPQTAFQCAFKFLFGFKDADVSESETFSTLAKHPHQNVIGIQIRVGDGVFMGEDNTHIEDFLDYFKCAEEIEKYFSGSHGFLWYLVSDSLTLRKDAKAKYGSKLVTGLQNVTHVECSRNIHGCTSIEPAKRALKLAASELLAFSYPGHHVSMMFLIIVYFASIASI